MKKILSLLLISNACFGQITAPYSTVSATKNVCQLVPNTVYILTDLGKIQLVAKTNNSFYEHPFVRTIWGMDFDEETFDFNAKQLMGIDNISCVIRCQNAVWSIVNDAGHKPQKVANVSDNLFVYYTKTYDKVLGFQTSIDETYAQSNYHISIGASVGLSFAVVLFFKTNPDNMPLQKAFITKQELSIPNSNIFISGRFGKIIQL